MTSADVRIIRLVGGFSLGLGMLMMIGTVAGLAFALYAASVTATFTIAVTQVAQFTLSLVMALTLTACGSQIIRYHPPMVNDTESLRLSWTALFVVMVISAVVGANIAPSLGFIALAVAILLLGIRRAVIRAIGR